jgi:hypothetical protein
MEFAKFTGKTLDEALAKFKAEVDNKTLFGK